MSDVSSSYSGSIRSLPSTAPSTPPPGLSGSYFLVCDRADVLKDVPAERASGDRIFFAQGTGSVKALLAQAADILDDQFIMDDARWEEVKVGSGSYFKTQYSIPAIERNNICLDAIVCKSDFVSVAFDAVNVGLLWLARVPTRARTLPALDDLLSSAKLIRMMS